MLNWLGERPPFSKSGGSMWSPPAVHTPNGFFSKLRTASTAAGTLSFQLKKRPLIFEGLSVWFSLLPT
jgi:hypothetical protein